MQDQDLFGALEVRVSDHTETPAVLLDRAFRIRAVNAPYERAMLRKRSELIGETLFDVFPDNPDDPHADGVDKLRASFETVIRTNSTVTMRAHRYDVADVANQGEFIPKVWIPKNMPIADGTKVVGIVSHVVEVADARHAVLDLARAIATDTRNGDELSPVELLHTLAAFTASLPGEHDRRQALADENQQLRRALKNRDIIGQAKGILMERFNTHSDGAFELLAKLSQESNLKLADLAGKLVQLEHPPD